MRWWYIKGDGSNDYISKRSKIREVVITNDI